MFTSIRKELSVVKMTESNEMIIAIGIAMF